MDLNPNVTTAVYARSAGRRLLESGRLSEARHQFWKEADDAERTGDRDAFAQAALGLGGVWVHEHRSIVERTRVLDLQRRALALLEPTSTFAGRLRTRLAAEDAYLTQDGSMVMPHLDAARSSGDPLWLAEALSVTHHALLGPDHGQTRLALAEELIGASLATHRPLDTLHGLTWRTVDLFLAGDRHAPRSLTELRERLAVERCDCFAYVVDALDVMLALRAGRLKEAESRAEACFAVGTDVGDADALGWYGAQLVAIRWYQGRAEEILPVVHDMAYSTTLATPNEAFFAAIAVLAVATGDVDEARGALASLTVAGLASIPRSSNWLATMLGVCEAAHLLGDVTVAREVYDLLLPFADLPIMVSLGVACFGSAHRPLGLAAATMGDLPRAIAHLEAATVADRSIRHGPAHVLDAIALADLLHERGEHGDHERADALRRSAIVEARRCGMDERADRWEADQRSCHREPVASCRRGGDGWLVSAAGRQVTVAHSVGMEYLSVLMARPGDCIPSVELASRHGLTLKGAPPEPVIDAAAKAAYRRKITELRDDIEDAERCADLERAARARAELDRYIDELARTTGISGRTRSFDDSAERARVSVNKALRRAIAQITLADVAIGEHIRVRVVTGLRCRFLADDPS